VPRKRALMACSNYWDSPFQVGSQHLARALVPRRLRRGLPLRSDFAHAPVPRLDDGPPAALRGNLSCPRQARSRQPPMDLCARRLADSPTSRSCAARPSWVRGTAGPGPTLRPWLPRAALPTSICSTSTACTNHSGSTLCAIATASTACRTTIRTSRNTLRPRLPPNRQWQSVSTWSFTRHSSFSPYVEALGARRTLLLANGVDYAHFASQSLPRPPEYRTLNGPSRFTSASSRIGSISTGSATPRRDCRNGFRAHRPRQAGARAPRRPANVHPLGVRPYATLPSYLQHAHVGLMPFNIESNPRGVEVLQPQKTPRVFRKWPARGVVRLGKTYAIWPPQPALCQRRPICDRFAANDDHDRQYDHAPQLRCSVQLGLSGESASGAPERQPLFYDPRQLRARLRPCSRGLWLFRFTQRPVDLGDGWNARFVPAVLDTVEGFGTDAGATG